MQIKVGAWRLELEAPITYVKPDLLSWPGTRRYPGLGWLLPGRLDAAALGAGIEARLAPIAINCINACHNNSAKNMDIGNNNNKK